MLGLLRRSRATALLRVNCGGLSVCRHSSRRAERDSVDRSLNDNFAFSDWKKKTVSLAVGYTGTGYYGLQFITGAADHVIAIQNVLHDAMCKAGLILPTNQFDTKRISLSQSSRTDKGVHAALVVLSAKLLVHPPEHAVTRPDPGSTTVQSNEGTMRGAFYPEVVERLNAHLPPHIRVFSCSSNSKSFSAKAEGHWRHYNYFVPLDTLSALHSEEQPPEAIAASLDDLMRLFEGTHDFAQFTQQREMRRQSRLFWEPADSAGNSPTAVAKRMRSKSSRNILRARAKLVTIDDRPFAQVDLVGQSFILNQIRYMMGGAIAVATGCLPKSALELCLRNRDISSDLAWIQDHKDALCSGAANIDALVAERVRGSDAHPPAVAEADKEWVPDELRPFRLPLAPPQMLVARNLGFSIRSNTWLVMPSSAPPLPSVWPASHAMAAKATTPFEERFTGKLVGDHLWYDDTRVSSVGTMSQQLFVHDNKKARGFRKGKSQQKRARQAESTALARFAVLDGPGIDAANTFYDGVLLPHVAELSSRDIDSQDESQTVHEWFDDLIAAWAQRPNVQAVLENEHVFDSILKVVDGERREAAAIRAEKWHNDPRSDNSHAICDWQSAAELSGAQRRRQQREAALVRPQVDAVVCLARTCLTCVCVPPYLFWQNTKLPNNLSSALVREFDMRPGRFMDNIKSGIRVMMCQQVTPSQCCHVLLTTSNLVKRKCLCRRVR